MLSSSKNKVVVALRCLAILSVLLLEVETLSDNQDNFWRSRFYGPFPTGSEGININITTIPTTIKPIGSTNIPSDVSPSSKAASSSTSLPSSPSLPILPETSTSGRVNSKCGQAKGTRDLTSRIISGDEILAEEAPYHVRLSKDEMGLDHFCSGVIINPFTILTAARCLFDENGVVKNVFAMIGEINSGKQNFLMNITNIRIHSKYKVVKGMPMHDIAMLKTSINMIGNRSDTINFVCLPKASPTYLETEQMFVTGWGYTNNEHQMSTVLKRAKLFPVAQDKCKKEYGKELITNDKVCAKNIYEAPCLGDWGAPLVRLVNGQYQLVGIFSVNRKSDHDDCLEHSSVYTKVSSYLDWINYIQN